MLRRILVSLLASIAIILFLLSVFQYYKYMLITKIVESSVFAFDNLRLPYEGYKKVNGQYPNSKNEFDDFIKSNDSTFFDFMKIIKIDYSILKKEDSVVFYSWGYDNVDDSIHCVYNLSKMTFFKSFGIKGDMIFSSFSLEIEDINSNANNKNGRLPIPPKWHE